MAPRNPPQQSPQRNEVDDAQSRILNNFADPDDSDDDLLREGNEPEFADDADDNDDVDENNQPIVQDEDENDDQNNVDENDQLPTLPVADQSATDKQFQFKEDREGNFIDKDGNIIVRRGKQRDLFVKLKKYYNTERNKAQKLTTDYQETLAAARELMTRYKDLKATKTHAESLGLTDEEAKTAAEVHALIKLDPKAGVRKILTMLHLGGTDLSEIGVKEPLDAKTVAEHLLAMQEAKRPKEKSVEDKAREEAEGFLGRFPDAQQYVGVLSEAKRRFPVMTYDQLWVQLLLTAQQKKAQPSDETDERRPPARVFPKNSNRPTGPVERGKKLSLKSVDPSQSFHQIGRDLLRDLKELDR